MSEFNPLTVATVLGGPDRTSPGRQRAPLHVDFERGDRLFDRGRFEIAEEPAPTDDETAFNAVGSRIGDGDSGFHLPVLDLNACIDDQSDMVRGSKVVVRASFHRTANEISKKYSPGSLLRDVLGDNGIDAEIDERPVTLFDHLNGDKRGMGYPNLAIALRSADRDVFETFSSAQEGHNILYVQREFSNTDHQVLLTALGELSLVWGTWQSLVEETGMSIARTPWSRERAVGFYHAA